MLHDVGREDAVHLHAQVVIIGAGPTGLTAANLLGMAGIETLLLERNAGLSDCPKAIALDDEGLRICQAIGLGEVVSQKMLLNVAADYRSGNRSLVRTAPTRQRYGHPLTSTFYQPEFEAQLFQGIARFACICVLFRHEVEGIEQDGERVRLRVCAEDGRQVLVECMYLLACDGSRSTARSALGIAMQPVHLLPFFHRPGRVYAEGRRAVEHTQYWRWLVIDSVEDDAPRVVTFFCDSARPAVNVPAPGRRGRWEFMLLQSERQEDLLAPEKIRELLKQGHAALGSAEPLDEVKIARRTLYTFYASVAAQMMSGRVFLLGDAGHLMPPFGGQGMNCGLRDAHNICWKLALILKGKASAALLESYEQERRPHAVQMIRFSLFLGTIVMQTNRFAAVLRNWLLRVAMRIPPIRDMLVEVRIKPPPRYKRGSFVPSRVHRRLVGVMLPQPYVKTLTGEQVLLDEVLGYGFALLRLGEDERTAFAPLEQYKALWQRLNARMVCICKAGESKSAGSGEEAVAVVDEEGVIGAFLGWRHDLFVLVRPDRFVMAVWQVNESKKIVMNLHTLLG